ncbi:MASE1 domain-containing protein [Sandaracinus amylolyticus]|uniref:histidine kinase n=1 Tax=Sandaracinus amylolyticus TaxID=927083 RepID=A0A0F6YN27_9BACT|nr:MASE1 domain-containing protein [Sandaracinus amylolyticus]AKF09926.1 sensory box histidine kinase/response regulator [Sandaracinus amylolyticus]
MGAHGRSAIALSGLAAIYIATGWVGMALASTPGNVSAVWLPSGIALAAVLVLGARVAPAIFAGGALLNALFYARAGVPSAELILASTAIGVGSTVQALVGRTLVVRFARGLDALRSPRSVGLLVACAGLACIVAATIGTATVHAMGAQGAIARTWLTWWLGDFMGVTLVVPIVLAFRARLVFDVSLVERAAYTIVLLVAIEVLFAPLGIAPGTRAPYVLLPIFVAIAYRLGPRDAGIATMLAWLGAIGALARGRRPLGDVSMDLALLEIDALVFALAMPALVLASAEWARRQSERELEGMRDELEARVAARTDELERANAELGAEIAERRRTEARLVESEARLETAIESLPFDFWILDRDERYVLVNSSAKAHWGDATGKRIVDLDVEPSVLAHWRENNARALAGEVVVRPVEHVHGGVARRYEGISAPIRVGDRVVGILGANVDVTERVRLTEQLVRAQKVETVGRLAGGVAHDFNNLLTIIGNASEALARRAPAGSVDAELTTSIIEATRQAADLTRRLLLFAGRHPADERVAPLDDLLSTSLGLLRPLFAANVAVRFEHGATIAVRFDPTRLGQILVNLAMNARDAMPDGGAFTVRTYDCDVGEACSEPWIDAPPAPGRYAMLEVSDTGAGMSDDVRRNAFEPFYTTKGAARGSGLGLASVHGIVRQAGGAIALESAPGRGTTFRIALPPASATTARSTGRFAPAIRSTRAHAVHSTVLLVEDDPGVRRTIARLLADQGHRVLGAHDVASARDIASREAFDVLISDVVMPGESGPTLARELRAARPDLPVLFVSAYAAKDTEGVEAPLLAKPFTADALGRAVASVLSTLSGNPPCPEERGS